MSGFPWVSAFAGAVLLAGGCDRHSASAGDAPPLASAPANGVSTLPAAPSDVAVSPVATPARDAGPEGWLGRWNGPEGTSLVLAPKEGGGYEVTITTLDGPTRYDGDAAGPNIVFDRDGETQTLRAGSGKLTGMKGLADKSNCLVIKPGEGYCRD